MIQGLCKVTRVLELQWPKRLLNGSKDQHRVNSPINWSFPPAFAVLAIKSVPSVCASGLKNMILKVSGGLITEATEAHFSSETEVH